MRFKSLHLYRLHEAPQLDAATLEQILDELAARPIGGSEPRRMGWTFPGDRDWHGTHLLHELQGQRLITALRQERLLPSTVVREEVEERTSFAILWNRINGPGSWDANPKEKSDELSTGVL